MSRIGKIAVLGWGLAALALGSTVLMAWVARDLYIEHRLATVQRVPVHSPTALPPAWNGDARRILVVGDSRIADWAVLPERADLIFATSAIGGETTGQLERRFARDVLELSPAPDEIVLAAGINDLVAASVQRRFAEAIRQEVSDLVVTRLLGLATRAQAAGIDVRIATVVQPASPDMLRGLVFWDDSLYGMVEAVNSRIRALERQGDIRILDLNSMLEGGSGPLPARFSADTLHFNTAAYTTLNMRLLEEFPAP